MFVNPSESFANLVSTRVSHVYDIKCRGFSSLFVHIKYWNGSDLSVLKPYNKDNDDGTNVSRKTVESDRYVDTVWWNYRVWQEYCTSSFYCHYFFYHFYYYWLLIFSVDCTLIGLIRKNGLNITGLTLLIWSILFTLVRGVHNIFVLKLP